MATSFWLHAQDSAPNYCPYCGTEYREGDPDHGEAGQREVVAGGDQTKTLQMYRCTTVE